MSSRSGDWLLRAGGTSEDGKYPSDDVPFGICHRGVKEETGVWNMRRFRMLLDRYMSDCSELSRIPEFSLVFWWTMENYVT